MSEEEDFVGHGGKKNEWLVIYQNSKDDGDIISVDVDANQIAELLEEIVAKYAGCVGSVFTSKTPRGRHFYFSLPPNSRKYKGQNSFTNFRLKVEHISSGSITVAGEGYKFEEILPYKSYNSPDQYLSMLDLPLTDPITVIPEPLRSSKVPQKTSFEYEDILNYYLFKKVQEGDRDNTIFKWVNSPLSSLVSSQSFAKTACRLAVLCSEPPLEAFEYYNNRIRDEGVSWFDKKEDSKESSRQLS